MAIVYCSWATGNDTTGDGTAANPFKTITKATTSRSPGDEVRVAKSPDPTALTGTTGWTENSTAVVGINTLFTSELAIGDFIKAPDGNWYEVITITDNTNVILYKKYPSTTSSGYSSQKLGVTDTGAASSSTAAVQTIGSGGNSTNRLLITGGWDLSTENQTSFTWFRQMHGTFTNRYGRGIYINQLGGYIAIEKIGLLRYYNGLYFYGGVDNHNLNNVYCASCSSSGVHHYSGSSNNNFENIVSISNGGDGIYLEASSNCNINNCILNANTNNGIYFNYKCTNNEITNVIANYNTHGILFDQCGDNINEIQDSTFNKNTSYGISLYNYTRYVHIKNVTCNYNKYGIYLQRASTANIIESAICSFNTTHGIFYEDGSSQNTIISATTNSNGVNGVDYYTQSNNNIIISLIANSNGGNGVNLNNAHNNLIQKITANGNSKVFYVNGLNNICYKLIKGISDVLYYTLSNSYKYPEVTLNINNLDGYSYAISNFAMANSQDATAGGTGKEWKFSITDGFRDSIYPFYIPIARIAVGPTGKVTVKVYFKKSGTGIAGALRCKFAQIAWSEDDEDIIVECPNDTNRNQVTLEFTPTEAGVVEIEAGAWYVSATDQNVIIDDIEISQE